MNLTRWLLTAWLLGWAVPAAGDSEAVTDFTLYLVRHAEKIPDTDDPGLTQAGTQRAEWLANWVSDTPVQRIWSSDYRRSRDTAGPVAKTLGTDIALYNPRQLRALATTLLRRGESALVVGHSNTTPELAALLCECPVIPMQEDEHDRILVVTVAGSRRTLAELDQRQLRLGIKPP